MSESELAPGQWTVERAREWGDGRAWICGFNFLPSTAVNHIEMWRAETFDADRIDLELGWAAEIGLNGIRTNLPFVVWENDPRGLIDRIDRFLAIAERHRQTAMICPFDDCGFGNVEPEDRPQPAPVPGVHNSRAMASPGRARLLRKDLWPRFEAYVKDIVGAFARDPRIDVWDLYNEPGNGMIFAAEGYRDRGTEIEAASGDLMRDAFRWARDVAPDQPLTVGAWRTPRGGPEIGRFPHPLDRAALDLSDVISFHAYLPNHMTRATITTLSSRGRPMFCTEWMARDAGSLIHDQLETMKASNVSCYHWGLVRGRTQTHLPWPRGLLEAIGAEVGEGWFHDLLEPDGTPHSRDEIEILRQAISTS